MLRRNANRSKKPKCQLTRILGAGRILTRGLRRVKEILTLIKPNKEQKIETGTYNVTSGIIVNVKIRLHTENKDDSYWHVSLEGFI